MQWSRVSGKRAHQKMLLIPMASLNHLDEMKGAEGFAAVTSNELFLRCASARRAVWLG